MISNQSGWFSTGGGGVGSPADPKTPSESLISSFILAILSLKRQEKNHPTLSYANHTHRTRFLSQNSQRDDVSVGCFHGDGQRVLTRLVSSVLIGSSLQQQTHLTAATNEKQREYVISAGQSVCARALASSRWRENGIY